MQLHEHGKHTLLNNQMRFCLQDLSFKLGSHPGITERDVLDRQGQENVLMNKNQQSIHPAKVHLTFMTLFSLTTMWISCLKEKINLACGLKVIDVCCSEYL